MVDQGGGSKATERTLSVLPLEKRAALATVLVAIAFACQQTVSGGLYAFNRYALSFGCGESPAMFPAAPSGRSRSIPWMAQSSTRSRPAAISSCTGAASYRLQWPRMQSRLGRRHPRHAPWRTPFFPEHTN